MELNQNNYTATQISVTVSYVVTPPFSDFMFAFLDNIALPKCVYFYKKQFASTGANTFLLELTWAQLFKGLLA